MDEQINEHLPNKTHNHWKMRGFIGLLLLFLSFVGLIVSDLHTNGAWIYWRWMIPVFGGLCLFLSWYLRRHTSSHLTAITIWHEVAQWIGLVGTVYVISIFVSMGIVGRFEAGLFVLLLLALTIFISGVYIEYTLIVIGLLLGLLAIGSALLVEYLYSVMLPIAIVLGGIIIWISRRKLRKH